MPLFAINNAQLCFQCPLYSLRAQMPYYTKGSSISIALGHELQCFPCAWKSLDKLKKGKFNVGRFELQKGRLLIKAVATFEPKTLPAKGDKCMLESKDLHLGLNPTPPGVVLEFSDEESEVLDAREKLRRMRISKANKGNTPWNKGRKHSPETLQKIKERTRLAMQNPKIKMKLASLGHAQTTETRLKIGAGVKMGWNRRRGKKMVQETCFFEWQNLIAEASRKGYADQEELQWNSYETLDEQLTQEWIKSVEQRKQQMGRIPGSKRAPKPPEQRRKIAEAIAAKWADPGYRERVCSALAKFHGTTPGAERKTRRRNPSDGTQPIRRNPAMIKDAGTDVKSRSKTSSRAKSGSKILNPIVVKKIKPPSYKDPLVNSKLEMIKNIRAHRAVAETERTLAIERARLMIAEAEKAAEALEVAAAKSSIAQASLIESRKLIAEAIQSLDSIATKEISESSVPSVAPREDSKEGGSAFEVLNQSLATQVNGHNTFSSSDYKFSEDLGKFSTEIHVNGVREPHLTSTNGCAFVVPSGLNSQIKESSPSNEERETEEDQSSKCKTDPSPSELRVEFVKDAAISTKISVARKWVRGRLVEVAEEEKQ